MAFEELKQKQSIIWGSAPYEALPAHYRPLLDHLERAIAVRPGERVLDIGTGTGALAVRLARAGAVVTGVDIAPALVETARRLSPKEGVQVDYRVGDAENLPCDNGRFDVVVSSIGSMFAPDHHAVARELARVCRPGGRLGLAHWSDQRGNIDIFKVLAPFQPSPPVGAGSPFQWGNPDYVRQLLGSAFELRFETRDAPQRGQSGEDVWQLFSTSYGANQGTGREPPARASRGTARALVGFYEDYRTGDGVHQPRPYLMVLGTRR